MTPGLFNKWMRWARTYKPKEENVFREFGIKIGPDWARTEFKDLDDFYMYYIDIVGE